MGPTPAVPSPRRARQRSRPVRSGGIADLAGRALGAEISDPDRIRCPDRDSAGMIAIPWPALTKESTAPSSSASTVAFGIQSCAAHQPRVYEPQFSAQSTSGSERGAASRRVHQRIRLFKEPARDQTRRKRHGAAQRGDGDVGLPVGHFARGAAPHLAHDPHLRLDPGVPGAQPLQDSRSRWRAALRKAAIRSGPCAAPGRAAPRASAVRTSRRRRTRRAYATACSPAGVGRAPVRPR